MTRTPEASDDEAEQPLAGPRNKGPTVSESPHVPAREERRDLDTPETAVPRPRSSSATRARVAPTSHLPWVEPSMTSARAETVTAFSWAGSARAPSPARGSTLVPSSTVAQPVASAPHVPSPEPPSILASIQRVVVQVRGVGSREPFALELTSVILAAHRCLAMISSVAYANRRPVAAWWTRSHGWKRSWIDLEGRSW